MGRTLPVVYKYLKELLLSVEVVGEAIDLATNIECA